MVIVTADYSLLSLLFLSVLPDHNLIFRYFPFFLHFVSAHAISLRLRISSFPFPTKITQSFATITSPIMPETDSLISHDIQQPLISSHPLKLPFSS